MGYFKVDEPTFYNRKSIKDIILCDLGVGAVVYSPIFGDLKFCGYENGLVFKTATNRQVKFNDDGKFDPSGDLMLFPSKDKQDWTTVPIKYPSSLQELHECVVKANLQDEDYLNKMKEKSPIRYLRSLLEYLDFLSINTQKQKDKFANCNSSRPRADFRRSDSRRFFYEIYPKYAHREWGKRVLQGDYAILACRSEKSADIFLELVPPSLLNEIFIRNKLLVFYGEKTN